MEKISYEGARVLDMGLKFDDVEPLDREGKDIHLGTTNDVRPLSAEAVLLVETANASVVGAVFPSYADHMYGNHDGLSWPKRMTVRDRGVGPWTMLLDSDPDQVLKHLLPAPVMDLLIRRYCMT